MATWFHRGGPTMLWLLGLGVPMLVIAVINFIKPARWTARAGAGLAALALVCGAAGMLQGRALTNAAVESVSGANPRPGELEDIRRVGDAEAIIPLEFGAGLAVLMLVAVGVGRARRRRGA